MKKQNMTNSLLAIFLAGFTVPTLAHTGADVTQSFMSGFVHPWLGIDHFLVMFAIGMWGCTQGGKQVWLLPLVFLLVMTIGAVLGFSNIILPYTELWVTLSVMVCGLIVGFNWKTSAACSMALIAIFALSHGYVHASEVAMNSDQTDYALGFQLTTSILNGLGITAGLFGPKTFKMIQISFGLVCTGVGVLLLAG